MVGNQLVSCCIVLRASFTFFQRASMIVSGLARVSLFSYKPNPQRLSLMSIVLMLKVVFLVLDFVFLRNLNVNLNK